MLSIQFIRQNPDLVREALEKRHDSAPLDEILSLDEQHRRLLQQLETLRARQKGEGKEIARLSSSEKEQKIAQLRQMGDKVDSLQSEVDKVEEQLQDLLLRVPNIPHSSVRSGKDDTDNLVMHTWGEPRQFDFPPLPHW